VTFIPFELERWQSEWEHHVNHNLSESGVHPLKVSELLEMSGANPDSLQDIGLGYSQADGTVELRSTIAGLYPGATLDNVIVTVGSSEANFISSWTIIEPGDHVATLVPMYRQTWGLAKTFGANVAEFALKRELGWEPDPDDVKAAIPEHTKLVVVTNPNNPTGHVLSEKSRKLIVDRTRAAGAWLLCDEVYQGAERLGETTESFWGSYERTIIVSGLSKAYGLPGLRIGWVVCPPDFRQAVYARHNYTVICPTPLSDYLARCAIGIRDKILSRTRRILNENYPILTDWLGEFGDAFDFLDPDCGAICFAGYKNSIDAMELAEKVRLAHSVLIQPGDHFGFERHLRLGFGNEPATFKAALEAMEPTMKEWLLG
jgi:aspartate/methionine/tyrosine aminotransferase